MTVVIGSEISLISNLIYSGILIRGSGYALFLSSIVCLNGVEYMKCIYCGHDVKIDLDGNILDCQGCTEKVLREKEIKKSYVFDSKNHHHLLKLKNDEFIFGYSILTGHKKITVHPDNIKKIELEGVFIGKSTRCVLFLDIHTKTSDMEYEIGGWTFEEIERILTYLHDNFFGKFEITELSKINQYRQAEVKNKKFFWRSIAAVFCFMVLHLALVILTPPQFDHSKLIGKHPEITKLKDYGTPKDIIPCPRAWDFVFYTKSPDKLVSFHGCKWFGFEFYYGKETFELVP